jgi:hypothetical protein
MARNYCKSRSSCWINVRNSHIFNGTTTYFLFNGTVSLKTNLLILFDSIFHRNNQNFISFFRDGLFLPKTASKVHPKFQTPYITTAITGSICAVAAAILPIDVLANLTSVGTLLAFFLVNISVMILRLTAPDIPRTFKVPGGPYVVPIIGAALSLLLLATATKSSIERLFIWMAIGLVIYFTYGRRHSKANNTKQISEKENITEIVELEKTAKKEGEIDEVEVTEIPN